MSDKSLVLVDKKDKTVSDYYMPPMDLRRFVQALFDEKVAGNKNEAERITGVDKGKFYYHLKKSPKFRQWYLKLCDEFLDSNASTVAAQLIKNIRDGDTAAIKIYYQLGGKLVSPLMQLNQQFNSFQPPPNCAGCTNKEKRDFDVALDHAAASILYIMRKETKDEELDGYNVEALIFLIRLRPFWFRRVLDAALKEALTKEAMGGDKGDIPYTWPEFLPCSVTNCSMRKPY